jgi:hypothetical protein
MVFHALSGLVPSAGKNCHMWSQGGNQRPDRVPWANAITLRMQSTISKVHVYITLMALLGSFCNVVSKAFLM